MSLGEPIVNAGVEAWLESVRSRTDKVKVLCGMRGCGKSLAFAAFRQRLVAEGVPEGDLVALDFERRQCRHLKTSADILAYLASFPTDRVRHLFLEGVSALREFASLFDPLLASGRWNVWMAVSNRRCLRPLGRKALVRRMWWRSDIRRDEQTLDRLWHTAFARDVPYGLRHIDIRAYSALVEYLFDHVGEEMSVRGISRDFRALGLAISPNTVKSYIDALEDSYLVEVASCWDFFEKGVTKSGFQAYPVGLELRAHRYGPSPEEEPRRQCLSSLYLQLREEYDKVYFTREPTVPFVTLGKNRKPTCWSYDIVNENSDIIAKKCALPPPIRHCSGQPPANEPTLAIG